MYSDEHKLFLSKIRKTKFIIDFFRIFIIIVFLSLWELLAKCNIINTFLYSSPSNIINTISSMIMNSSLFKHIGVTLYELLISFGFSVFISVGVATILWSNETLYKIIEPYISILNSLPKVALGPLIIIWFGANFNSIIFMSLLISTFVTILNIYNGFISVNKNFITMLKSFGANKFSIFTKVIFPNNILNIFSSLKINISMTLIGVIMGELLISKSGIGYLIMYGSQVFNLNLVITGILLLCILSYILYIIVYYIEKKLVLKN